MATSKENPTAPAATVEDGWEVVREETPARVLFDTVGDQFVGTYEREMHVIPENGSDEFDLFVFRVDQGPVAVNSSYSIRDGLRDVPPGTTVRITYVKDIDTGKDSPMKDFRVEVKRS